MLDFSILPVARVMIGHYQDAATAQHVVYELVRNGTGRHNIATYPADEKGVDADRDYFDTPEKKDQRPVVASGYGVLVVAWVTKPAAREAERIMKSHNPKGFRNRFSRWETGGTLFEWILAKKKQA